MFLTLLSISSLVVSFTLSISLFILKNNSIEFLKRPIFINFSESSLVQCLIILSLFTYRAICHFPKAVFYSYVFSNFGIIILFYFVRMHVIMHTYTGLNNNSYLIFFFLFIISSIFALTRLFFRVGYVINESSIVNIILEQITKQTGFFATLGKRICGQLPTNPGAGGTDKHFIVGVGTFCATAVAAGGGVYLGYEAYQSRQIALRAAHSNEVTANAAEVTAKAAEAKARAIQERTDIKAVKHGLMSVEDYNKKYSK